MSYDVYYQFPTRPEQARRSGARGGNSNGAQSPPTPGGHDCGDPSIGSRNYAAARNREHGRCDRRSWMRRIPGSAKRRGGS
jgi:hypothetical protein